MKIPRPDPKLWISWLRERWVKVLVTVGLLAVFFGNQGFQSLVRNWLILHSPRRFWRNSRALSTGIRAPWGW